jgi:hypothetical protein
VEKERRSEKELRQMMLAAASKHEECSELEDIFIFGLRHAQMEIGALGSLGKITEYPWPATRASIKSLVNSRQNMNCIRSRRPNARSKRECGPWSMTNQRLRLHCRVLAAPTIRSVQTQIELEQAGREGGTAMR